MKFITESIKNIKNLLPYLLLIAIYFFFINLEAINDKENNIYPEIKKIFDDDKSRIEDKKLRISIPVIPYDE